MGQGYFITASADVAEAAEKLGGLVRYHRATGAEDALAAAGRAVGISRWSVWNLLKGRRKAVGSSVLAAIREEYLRYCERQLALFEAERRAAEKGCGNDLSDLATEARALVARLEKARRRGV